MDKSVVDLLFWRFDMAEEALDRCIETSTLFVFENDLIAMLKSGKISFDHILPTESRDNLLFYAVKHRKMRVLHYLLENKAWDLQARDSGHKTVAYYAIRSYSVMRLLVIHGYETSDLLRYALYQFDIKMILLLYAAGGRDSDAYEFHFIRTSSRKPICYHDMLVLVSVYDIRNNPYYDAQHQDVQIDPSVRRLLEEGPTLAERCLFTIECAKILQEIEDERKKIKKE